MTVEEFVKMWTEESNAANDIIIDILESYMEFINIVDKASKVQSLRQWQKIQPIMHTLLKKHRRNWQPILAHAQAAKELANGN